MTACFLIFLYVRFEVSYDRYHEKGDRVYRVHSRYQDADGSIESTWSRLGGGAQYEDYFPEVESFVRLNTNNILIRKGDVKFQEENSLYADSAFFQVFSFKLLHGNPRTALKEPLSIVFSESAAKKYFGDADPVGRRSCSRKRDMLPR